MLCVLYTFELKVKTVKNICLKKLSISSKQDNIQSVINLAKTGHMWQTHRHIVRSIFDSLDNFLAVFIIAIIHKRKIKYRNVHSGIHFVRAGYQYLRQRIQHLQAKFKPKQR